MCGIRCSVCQHGESRTETDILKRRGPNSSDWCKINRKDLSLVFLRFLLHIRGPSATRQRIENLENVVLYCGEVYNSDVDESCGDTQYFRDALSKNGVLSTCKTVVGEYAFIFFDTWANSLWFGRDCFGRRSLIFQNSGHGNFCLSSVCENTEEAHEVPSEGLFRLEIKDGSFPTHLTFYPYFQHWNNNSSPFIESWKKLRKLFSITIGEPILPQHRTQSLLNDKFFDLNIAHECPSISLCSCNLVPLIPSQLTTMVLEKFLVVLRRSVERRVCLMKRDIKCGILFSGGIDCSVLARLMHEFYPENEAIELVNVAFEINGTYDTPDRITAGMAFRELQRTQPEREWRLVCVNVTKAELQEQREKRIRQILHPCQSVLDDSIGCALWFAARGADSTVLLSGIGADEQLGGYSRHRGAFKNGGWQTLKSELKRDLDRIGFRNMGRDDRVIADHGKELRMPYLDEEVVAFLDSLPPWHKTNPLQPRDTGDKCLLREVAKLLSLSEVSTFAKRAIQFGSRIAKLESKKEKASDQCSRLID